MSRRDLDRANPITIADQLRLLRLGHLFLGQMNQHKRKVNPSALGVNAYNLATLHALQLPDRARAVSVVRATVRAGGVTGELTPVAFGVTPTTGQIAVAPNGDIVVLASDAITDMDVTYVSERGDVMGTVQADASLPFYSLGLYFPVVSNVLTLPTSGWGARGNLLLLEAEAINATATGKKIPLIPGAGAPAAGQARLNLAKTTVTFAGADAVTRARVKLLIAARVVADGNNMPDDLQVQLNETDTYL